MSAVVVQLFQSRPARAAGAFAAVNIAARRLGYSDSLALRAAQAAKKRVLTGETSTAKAVADARAELRRRAEPVSA